ncbi:hypothetical protein GIY62_06295 [Burkholderia plantarii]|uniref:hypothetical protein n=1 Tax=Burkholderia plantarii TaxID=41899 RepID=UPI00272CA154|nr:hypothetical protein [Burkholderia plantarii]WLE60268.1 hypothetical protein GIY62_06295 [Burkholderia plantarii]
MNNFTTPDDAANESTAGDRNNRYWIIRGFPERDATKGADSQGLYRKYEVKRADGSDAPGGKHHGCEFFVLDLTHDAHAPAAMIAYARSAAASHPQLAADIISRFDVGDTADAAMFNGRLNAAPALLALSALLAAIDGASSKAAAYAPQAVALGVMHEVAETLRAALAAFPKSAAQACIERALALLQGKSPTADEGSDVFLSSLRMPELDEAAREQFIANFARHRFDDIGPLETGENHHE